MPKQLVAVNTIFKTHTVAHQAFGLSAGAWLLEPFMVRLRVVMVIPEVAGQVLSPYLMASQLLLSPLFSPLPSHFLFLSVTVFLFQSRMWKEKEKEEQWIARRGSGQFYSRLIRNYYEAL